MFPVSTDCVLFLLVTENKSRRNTIFSSFFLHILCATRAMRQPSRVTHYPANNHMEQAPAKAVMLIEKEKGRERIGYSSQSPLFQCQLIERR